MNKPPESAGGRYHHGDLRRALLEAAAKAADIEHISLRELASGLGVSGAAVYRHFASRDALLAELAAIGIAQLQQRFAETFDLHSPPADAQEAIARLHRLGVAYLRFADEQPAMWRLIFGTHAVQARAEALRTGKPTSYSYLPAALQGLHEAGLMVAPPSPGDLLFTWSTVHGAAALRVGNVAPAQGEVERVGAEIVQRILRGIGARPQQP
ncbi:TetR/AcrR family transcriptional regulator [Dyella soli]|uniref:TetR/AcrR family transcriptional regulator n=1 Tax=Dyella soli TaxID=522319 RepID=A0A4R0YQG1_9GAMM|nr:TetR/AcrR family transcriptional regulator [Dyella soli]TCI11209.1 TetR/AcrR family transcriptional regulator [Dyella soli]